MIEAIVNVSALMIPLAAMIVSLMGLIGYLIKHIYQQNEKLAEASAENKRLEEKIIETDNTRKSLASQIESAIKRFNRIFGKPDGTGTIDTSRYSLEGLLEKLSDSWYSIGHSEGYVDGWSKALGEEEVSDPEETKDNENES